MAVSFPLSALQVPLKSSDERPYTIRLNDGSLIFRGNLKISDRVTTCHPFSAWALIRDGFEL